MVDQFSSKPHLVPLVDFVNRLRDRYPNGYVPHFDENDGGVDAEILFLFEKPGPMTDPARGGSGFISQDNDDPTARATKGFLQDAGIDRKKIAIWNTISAWNGTVNFTSEEKRYALEEFAELLSIMKKVRCLVLVGREAQKIETKINLNKYQILRSYHPSPKVKSSMPDAWAEIPRVWREAVSDQRSIDNLKQKRLRMQKQEKIIREFFSKIEEQQGQSPKELPPRSGEKYRFAWKMAGDEGQSSYELFQMGDCLYLTADTETLADNDEYKMLQLLNWLNGWSHYGIFTYSPQEKIVCYEQTHFCRYFEYTVAEIDDFYRQMIKRMSVYHLSADDVFNNGTDIEKAVDMANRVVRSLHS